MEEKFITLFKETLEISDQVVNLDTKFRDMENWDSISFLSVIAMIDEEFDIIIEGNDFRKLITIEDVINEITRRKS